MYLKTRWALGVLGHLAMQKLDDHAVHVGGELDQAKRERGRGVARPRFVLLVARAHA